MREYRVEITLLSENLTYDVVVSEAMQVGILAQLCAEAFSKLSGGRYLPGSDPVLYDKDAKKNLNATDLIQNSEIRNGSRLLLY